MANVGRRAGGTAGRGLGGVGRTVAAGAGVGAGLAVFEQVFERIFELFEGTPVLETFTMAIDTLFKAFGPVVGVLLEGLTPVIVALTPAIEPLARALIPLVEIFGTNLLIAVQLLTPLITFAAKGIAFLTKGLQTFINQGITFVIDQLNKIPFVDIQFELAGTGYSFDRMTTQIEAAGDAAGTGPGTAEGNIKALATATVTYAGYAADLAGVTDQVAEASRAALNELGILQQRELEAASATELLRLSIVNNTDATSFQKQAQDAAAAAALELESALIAQGLAAGAGTPEADLFALSLGTVRMGFTNVSPEVSALDERIQTLTFQITDATAAAELQEMALAGLTPEMRAAAAELGLFGLKVEEVATAAGIAAQIAADAVDAARRATAEALAEGFTTSSSRGTGEGIQTSRVRIGPDGELIYSEGVSASAGGPGSQGAGQRLYSDSAGNVYYDANLNNPASDEAQQLADQIAVTVQIDGETVATATTRSESEGG